MADDDEEQAAGGPTPHGGVGPQSAHNNPPNRTNEAEVVEMGELEEAQKKD